MQKGRVINCRCIRTGGHKWLISFDAVPKVTPRPHLDDITLGGCKSGGAHIIYAGKRAGTFIREAASALKLLKRSINI
jgi:hypothetical protein